MKYVVETDKAGVVPVKRMFDINGNDTNAAWKVEAVILELPNGEYLSLGVYPEQVHAIQ